VKASPKESDKAKKSEACSVVAFVKHDHQRCKRSVMYAVKALCKERQLRFTPVRQRTLEILLQSHRGLGAYEVLAKLASNGLAQKPPQVYRALGFLIEQGFAHKLEQQNAYVACCEPGTCVNPCFMVCASCGRVAEQPVPSAARQLVAAASDLGFSASKSVMELVGVCNECPG